ncbi:cytochrome b/b6 domain-containing protein, partial [Castellaniella defragrans]
MVAQKWQSIEMVSCACHLPRASTPSSWNLQVQRMKGCYPRRAWPSRCDNLSNTEPGRIQRHSRAVRLVHGANAVATIVLIATGLALGDDISPVLVAALGGHAVANEMHRLGGVAFAVVLLLAAGLFHSPTRDLMRDLVYFRHEECRWPQSFLKCILSPAHGHTAFHNGRFDPAQRLILLLLLCSTALVAAAGVYLYILPATPQWVFLIAIRIHIYGAWIAIIALCLHAFAGLGVLHTHC